MIDALKKVSTHVHKIISLKPALPALDTAEGKKTRKEVATVTVGLVEDLLEKVKAEAGSKETIPPKKTEETK